MERSLTAEWDGALKAFKDMLEHDDEVSMYSAKVGEILKKREKAVTSMAMAKKGLDAQLPMFHKVHDGLDAEAKDLAKNLDKIARKIKSGSNAKRAREIADDADTFFAHVHHCDIGDVDVTRRFERDPLKALKTVELDWKELSKYAKHGAADKAIVTELTKRKPHVEKLLKALKAMILRVQKAHTALMGHNAKRARDDVEFEKPAKLLHGILKSLRSDPRKKKDAAQLLGALDGIEKMMHDFTM